MISNKTTYKYLHGGLTSAIYGSASLTPFDDWSQQNRAVLDDFNSFMGSKSKRDTIMDLIWNNELPGWGGPDGQEYHDLALAEFGWECLPYTP